MTTPVHTARAATRPRPLRAAGAELRFYAGLVALIALCTGVVIVGFAVIPVLLGYRAVTIESGSMEPGIRRGDVVLLRTGDLDRIEPGRVVTFAAPGTGARTTHRVIGVPGDGTIVTKGDANRTADSTPVPLRAVEGRVVAVVPYAGVPLLLWSEAAWGRLLVLAITVAGVAWVSRYALDPEHDPWEVRDRARTAGAGA